MEDNVLQLHIWPGDWDLPSVDPNCLAVLAYCRFSGVPVKVHKASNTWKSPNGNFPLLKHNSTAETKVANIFSFLRKKNWGSDFGLSNKQSADVVAYSSMLDGKLLPGFLHIWWVDTDSYANLTRPWYTKATNFPMKFWQAGRIHSDAVKRVYDPHTTDNTEEADIEAMIYRNAKDCLTNLSQKLGDQEYFFGSSPSSLDALVFGFVAPLLKAPLSSNQLTTHLRSFCENLCLHCNRILHQFFPLTPEELEAKQKEAEKIKKAEGDSLDYPNKKRNLILAGVFALTAMVAYAFATGLVRIETIDEDDES